MICWRIVFVGQLLHHHRDLPPWRPRRPGQRAWAGWEEVEEARGRKQSISGQNQSSFCENNRQFRKLQIYQSNLLQSINLLQSTNQSLQSANKHSMWKKSFKKVWSLSFLSQLHQSTEFFNVVILNQKWTFERRKIIKKDGLKWWIHPAGCSHRHCQRQSRPRRLKQINYLWFSYFWCEQAFSYPKHVLVICLILSVT